MNSIRIQTNIYFYGYICDLSNPYKPVLNCRSNLGDESFAILSNKQFYLFIKILTDYLPDLLMIFN